MDESPSKRRKTSPTVSITISASNSPRRPPSRDRRLSTPVRASFMSPTKASLARFNPNLLLPSASAENKLLWPNGDHSHGSGDEHPAESNLGGKMVNGSPKAAQRKDELGSEDLTSSIRNSTGGTSMQSLVSHMDGVLTDSRIAIPTAAVDSPLSMQNAISVAQEIRASPPTASEDEERTVLNNQLERIADNIVVKPVYQIRSDDKHIPDQPDEQEEQLPYTPTKHPVDDSEPRLPSTPTQLGLEPPPSPPKGLLLSSPNRRGKRKRRFEPGSSPLKPKDSISAEKVEKLYISSLGPRILINDIQPSTSIVPASRKNGIKSRSSNSLRNLRIDQPTKPPSLSQRLALFLPFSKLPDSRQNSATPLPDVVLNGTNPSNSLQITSTESIATSPDSDGQNIDHHDITLTSPQHLLIVKIRLDIDRASNKNTELVVSSLSSWAIPELGSWLKTKASSLNKTTIEKTIGHYWKISEIRAVCWHQCEEQIVAELLNNKPITTPDIRDEKAQAPQSPQGNGKINASSASDEPPSSDPSSHPLPQPTVPLILRHLLLQHLGRQSMLFTRSPVSLLITWQIIIAPTGDVQSRVAAYATFPQRWMQSKSGEALGSVGEAFDLLVIQRGVFESVKTICGLVFGS